MSVRVQLFQEKLAVSYITSRACAGSAAMKLSEKHLQRKNKTIYLSNKLLKCLFKHNHSGFAEHALVACHQPAFSARVCVQKVLDVLVFSVGEYFPLPVFRKPRPLVLISCLLRKRVLQTNHRAQRWIQLGNQSANRKIKDEQRWVGKKIWTVAACELCLNTRNNQREHFPCARTVRIYLAKLLDEVI